MNETLNQRKNREIKNRRARWRAAGLCIRCGLKRDGEFVTCLACLSKMSGQRKSRYSELKRTGLCIEGCGSTAQGTIRCLVCQEKHNSPRRGENQRQWRRALRLEIVQAYGGKCNCCGESEPLFLELDHINNDGGIDRKNGIGRGGSQFYAKLKSMGFPKDRFQLLCVNCNRGKHLNGGVCPHKTKLAIAC